MLPIRCPIKQLFQSGRRKLHLPSAIFSQQIQALKREPGFQLPERKNRTFALTPAGEYFYRKSLILTADYERMSREAAKIAKGNRASLKIGYLRCYTGRIPSATLLMKY